MSSSDPWLLAGSEMSEDAGTSSPGKATSRLNQPWRGWIALAEILVAAGLVVLAFWAWTHAEVRIALPGPHGTTDVVTRMFGNWLASAVAAAAVAGGLIIDAVRQLVLAVRVR